VIEKLEGSMDTKLHKHWLNIINPLFPENAELISTDSTDEFLVSASWKLNNDTKQPNKKSRTIVIQVPKETIDDYCNKSEIRKIHDDEKLFNQVKEFLHFFNPNHNTPAEEVPPEARLIACKSVLDS
jgi:hypothetical protein